MSTKIYNGYKIQKMNMVMLLQWCRMTQTDLTRVRDFLIKSRFTETEYEEGYWERRQKVRENDLKGVRDDLDYSANVILIPRDQDILALTFWEQRGYTKIWEDSLLVSEYMYWNNTDEPENVTEEEWDQKRIDWDKALAPDGWGTPAECGFNYEFIPIDLPRVGKLFGEKK